jgi:hypothetical protein
MSTRILFTLCLLVSVCAACAGLPANPDAAFQEASALWANPEPMPDYLWSVFFGAGTQCVEINGGFFTDEVLSNGSASLSDFADNVAFIVDGNPVEVIGLGNDRFAFYGCFVIDRLGEGLHAVTLKLTKFSGVEATYSWAFRMKGQAAGLSHDALAALVELPTVLTMPNPANPLLLAGATEQP